MKKKHLKKVRKALYRQGLLWATEIDQIIEMLKGKKKR